MLEDELFLTLRREIRSGLDVTSTMQDDQLMEHIERYVLGDERLTELTSTAKRKWVRRLYDSFRGLDVLQPLIDDRTITEIMINGHEEIFIEQAGAIRQLTAQFESRGRLEDIIQSIVSNVNRVVNESSPIVDARLKDGSRVNIVLPPISLKGPAMTIRKFPERPLSMDDLVAKGSLDTDTAEWLKKLIYGKFNIFISGGTGSGKTTFLNALSQYIPSDERVITIEDSAELQIVTVPNLVSLETRNANTEGKGEVTVRDLIRSSLRMRPNRIIVGEVRGAEALDMLQAMNTGHDGSLSTGHANNTADMISRLETMVLSGADLPIGVVRKQIASAIDIFIHLSRLRDRSRRVMEISEVIGMEDGEVVLNRLYQFKELGEEEGKLIGVLERTGTMLRTEKLSMAGIAADVTALSEEASAHGMD
ncbi:CpaF family protein [Paenibacillus brevis]|nr:CpaF family protein [Paenibacillus brevis]MBU5671794.1 CpaF family protein [Paenibacillus brevis]